MRRGDEGRYQVMHERHAGLRHVCANTKLRWDQLVGTPVITREGTVIPAGKERVALGVASLPSFVRWSVCCGYKKHQQGEVKKGNPAGTVSRRLITISTV